MTVHLLKLCVGVDAVSQLVRFQENRRAAKRVAGEEPVNIHVTRNTPRRADEVVDGGSLYWVIRRRIAVRQRIIRIDEVLDDEGRPRCGLVLGPDLVRTEPRSCRPFQGWRYLEAHDAPADLTGTGHDEVDEMPEEMVRELRALGLL